VKKLTLSFDNGPFPEVTTGVLDLLRANHLKATFFVCGKDARDPSRRRILEAARSDGHWIGNHTMTHSIELGCTVDPDAPRTEIGLAQTALGDLSNTDRLFRPYGGGGVLGPRLLSPAAVRFLCDGGYTCVLWNSIPRDWEDVTGWPERALRQIREQDWTLVVLHDVPTGAMEQLPRFLDQVRDEGVEITQELPDACIPIRRGEIIGPIDHLVPSR